VTVVLFAGAAPASADTFGVTRTDDPDPPGDCQPADCSLREAILAANGHTGPDTVLVESGETYELSIANGNEDVGMTGDLDSTGALTLKSAGPGRATIDANAIDRVIEAFKPATFIKLNITGGDVKGTDGYGGGVSGDALLRFQRSRIVGNHAVFNGGGIRAEGSRVMLIRSKVLDNTTPTFSGAGGVISNGGTIEHSRIAGNETGSCGGVWMPYGNVRITNSVFKDNQALHSGGGGCIGNYEVTIEGSRFVENTAGGSAGGLTFGESRGTVTETTFDLNQAGGAGGGFSASGTDLKILRSTISRNQALGVSSGSGGGVALRGGEIRFVNSTIARNEAAASGGGIFTRNPDPTVHGIGHVRLAFSTVAYNDGDSDHDGGDIGGGIMEGLNGEFDDVHGTLIAFNAADSDPNCAASVTSTGHNLLNFVGSGCTGFNRPTDIIDPDPKLDDLGRYGGPTETVSLQLDSPAIDAGGNNGPPTDQRGVPRPRGPRYDIGAFERRP
jgi:CSLREA domain-containing protein